MKKSIILIIAIALLCTLVFTACDNREKFDMSKVESISDLGGAVLAAQSNTFHLKALTEQTTGVTVKDYPDFTKLLVALNSGAVDGYIAEEPTALSVTAKNHNLAYVPLKNNSTGFTTSNEDTGIAVAFKTGSELREQVNAILDTISEGVRSKLMAQCVTMSLDNDKALGENIALSSSKTDTSKGVLKIAMECAYAPFNWSQTTDVNGGVAIKNSTLYANGYDVQVAKYIAAELGMELEIYACEWNSLVPGVQAGTYHGIIAGMSPTADREEEVDFTNCYYNSNLVIIYKK